MAHRYSVCVSVSALFNYFESLFRSKVHLCEIENPQDLPSLEFPFNVRKGRPLLVAVKILRPDASKNARFVTSPTVEQSTRAVHFVMYSCLNLQDNNHRSLVRFFFFSHISSLFLFIYSNPQRRRTVFMLLLLLLLQNDL